MILLSVTPYISGAVLQKAFKLHEPVTEIPLVPSHAITKPEHAHPHINRILGNPIPVPSELFKAAAPLLKYLRDASVRRILSRTPYGVRERYNFTDTSMMDMSALKALHPIVKLFLEKIPDSVIPQVKKSKKVRRSIRSNPLCAQSCDTCLKETFRNCYVCFFLAFPSPCTTGIDDEDSSNFQRCAEQYDSIHPDITDITTVENTCD